MTPGPSLRGERRVLGATIEQWALVTARPLNQAVNNALFTVVGPFRAGFSLNYAWLGVVLASYGLARFFMDVPACRGRGFLDSRQGVLCMIRPPSRAGQRGQRLAFDSRGAGPASPGCSGP
jgi:hypothetical protein